MFQPFRKWHEAGSLVLRKKCRCGKVIPSLQLGANLTPPVSLSGLGSDHLQLFSVKVRLPHFRPCHWFVLEEISRKSYPGSTLWAPCQVFSSTETWSPGNPEGLNWMEGNGFFFGYFSPHGGWEALKFEGASLSIYWTSQSLNTRDRTLSCPSETPSLEGLARIPMMIQKNNKTSPVSKNWEGMTNGRTLEVSNGDGDEADSTRLGEPTQDIAHDTKGPQEKTPPHHHLLQPLPEKQWESNLHLFHHLFLTHILKANSSWLVFLFCPQLRASDMGPFS